MGFVRIKARNLNQLLIGVALSFLCATMMTGCGQGGTGSSGTSASTTGASNTGMVGPTSQMGGARQGNALTLAGKTSTLAGTAGAQGSIDGTGPAAQFYLPYGVTTDGTNLYIADTYNNTIREVVIATGAVTTLAGTAGTTGSANATGAAASFNLPGDITTDGTNLYVADSGNHAIRKVVIATGAVTTLAGTAGMPGSTDATGAAARFVSPIGITTDGVNLYVGDDGNNTVRKVVIATGVVTTLAGTAGITGSTDATGHAASFKSPQGITTDGTNLYVADSGNNTIRKVVIATGAVTTLAGTAGITGSSDATGAAASFSFPQAVTTDGTNLYIADSGNRTIRELVIATDTVTTLAGTAGVFGSTDATGPAASFSSPEGITTDGAKLYVCDSLNDTIRAIQ